MTRQSVSQVLQLFNKINDSILLYYNEHFIELCRFIILQRGRKSLITNLL